MEPSRLDLPAGAAEAVRLLRETSMTVPVLVIKKSPICGVSAIASRELEGWLRARGEGEPLALAEIDVIAERSLARGLTEELGIEHRSPQALLFRRGELVWHGSHYDLSAGNFAAEVDGSG